MKKSVVLLGAATLLLALAPGARAKQTKVDICHVPPGNPANAHTISVGAPAVPAHVAHGDTPCSCEVVADCAEQHGELNLETCECEVAACSADWICGAAIPQCGTGGLGVCVCDLTVEGDSFCWEDFSCGSTQSCDGSSDCPEGSACVTTCCGQTCAPTCSNPGDNGAAQSSSIQSNGPTATGN